MNVSHAERLASFPMFEGYTAYGLEVLLEGGATRELAPGELLYAQGEPATFVALVVSGRLSLFLVSSSGEQPLADAGPSRLLGELAALAGVDRVMSARAAEPTTVVQWSADAFRRLLNNDVEMSQRIFRETFRSIVEERRSLVAALAAARANPAA
jgi:CRP-like cAMP-binding protein